jgi:hypothetical protein
MKSLKEVNPVILVVVAVRVPMVVELQVEGSHFAMIKLSGLPPPNISPGTKVNVASQLVKTEVLFFRLQYRFTHFATFSPDVAACGCNPGVVEAVRVPEVVMSVKSRITGV